MLQAQPHKEIAPSAGRWDKQGGGTACSQPRLQCLCNGFGQQKVPGPSWTQLFLLRLPIDTGGWSQRRGPANLTCLHLKARTFWPNLCHTDDRTDESPSCIRWLRQQNRRRNTNYVPWTATNSSKDNYSHFPILGSVTVSGWVNQLQLLGRCQSSYWGWEEREHDVVYPAAVYLPFITHEADDEVNSIGRDSQNHNVGFPQERQEDKSSHHTCGATLWKTLETPCSLFHTSDSSQAPSHSGLLRARGGLLMYSHLPGPGP